MIYERDLQFPPTDRAKEMSDFVTPDGLLQCKFMPFGMRNLSTTFQRVMNKVTDVLDCVVYLDVVVFHSNSWANHVEQCILLATLCDV